MCKLTRKDVAVCWKKSCASSGGDGPGKVFEKSSYLAKFLKNMITLFLGTLYRSDIRPLRFVCMI
jgi:hypothetical protein